MNVISYNEYSTLNSRAKMCSLYTHNFILIKSNRYVLTYSTMHTYTNLSIMP